MGTLRWVQFSPIALILLLHTATNVSSFQVLPNSVVVRLQRLPSSSTCLRSSNSEEAWGDDDDFEILFEEKEEEPNLDATEKAWRYAKKPLLSIGAKGASFSHGNSLRQLLDSHTVVKVKVNTKKSGKLSKDVRSE